MGITGQGWIKRSPPGSQFWQHFKYFVAAFRCLKSRVLGDGQATNISTTHAEAHMNCDIQFTNHHLELDISFNQQVTRSASHPPGAWNVHCEFETVNVHQGKHCIVNGMSASDGDSFLCLDSQPPRNEIHQCKLLKESKIDKKAYVGEREKSVSDNDFLSSTLSKKNSTSTFHHFR
jgi:hypothetical protein